MDLELSNAQKEIFAGWRRLLDTHGSVDGPANEPDLVQDITTDCSVVASLCAGVARSSKGHAKVIHSTQFFSIRSSFWLNSGQASGLCHFPVRQGQ